MLICSECKHECTPQPVNNGIGRIEAWGRITHHDEWDVESDCCDAPVIDSASGEQYDYLQYSDDQQAARDDFEYEQYRERYLLQ